MKTLFVSTTMCLAVAASSASAFDQATLTALKACHDFVWTEIPPYSDLPNAAISAYPYSSDGDSVTTVWHVRWDDPEVKSAGICEVVGGKVERVEDYTK